MTRNFLCLLICFYYCSTVVFPLRTDIKLRRSSTGDIPPPPKYADNDGRLTNKSNPFYLKWNSKSETNVWETSGLFEGDIMTYSTRNALLNDTIIWPEAVVKYYIDPQDFDEYQMGIILNGMEEYHERTCVKFKPYEYGDLSWVTIRGNTTGCWSSVGMRFGGQVLNLNPMKCVRHGTVVHELLHVLGFVHQQSAPDRDDYVKVIWENIRKDKKRNFRKYNHSQTTSFGVGYDYESIMHYGRKAFSKNGEPTLLALKKGVKIGQRKKLSIKDVLKLNKMYGEHCKKEIFKEPEDEDDDEFFLTGIVEFFENMMSEIFAY